MSRLPDADMRAASASAVLLRAAPGARGIARQTGTAVVVVRDRKLVEDREAAAEPAAA